MTFWYFATPYAKYPHGQQAAYHDAVTHAARLVELGVKLFCPIAHSHPMAEFITPSDPHRFWLDLDRPFMEAARGLIICQLPGWADSAGITEEIEYFQSTKKPIVYFDPHIPANDLPKFIEGLNTESDAQILKDLHYYCWARYSAVSIEYRKPLEEEELVNWLRHRTGFFRIAEIISLAERIGILRKSLLYGDYTPQPYNEG